MRYSPPETRGVLRTLFAQNPSLTARGARKAYWNRRAQRYMYTPFEGACTETIMRSFYNACIVITTRRVTGSRPLRGWTFPVHGHRPRLVAKSA